MSRWKVEHGDNRDLLKLIPDNSIDSIVTDPPYELGFMGKSWDATGIAYNVDLWRECLRVLKPGGHILAFGGSRTYHRLACAVEDAGFEIRDQIMWVYGSGFPKSMNISKAIDKMLGAEREVVGVGTSGKSRHVLNAANTPDTFGGEYEITAAASDEAKQWEGWGTALKPAHEPMVLARKPLDGTVANNVLQHGTGALNIDASRVRRADGDDSHAGHRTATFGTQETLSGGDGSGGWSQNDAGRWPANFIHDGSDEVLELFPDTGKSTGGRIGKKSMGNVTNVPAGQFEAGDPGYGDSGSAARFFYCAKANKTDRNEGLDDFTDRTTGEVTDRRDGSAGLDSPRAGAGRTSGNRNHHPTVKPTTLMRYLVRLITPPDGTVLDPFTGSGSTGKAAILEGFRFHGIEQDPDYVQIARARIGFVE